jgi:hypothetical protein
MADDYPSSRWEMYYSPTQIPSVVGLAFYQVPFKSLFAGTCYGMAATSIDLFTGAQSAPVTPLPTYEWFGTPSTILPFVLDGGWTDASVTDYIKRFHSRQLAALGAAEEASLYASAVSNPTVFDRVSTWTQTGPVAVAIVPSRHTAMAPSRWWYLMKKSHVVVAYGTKDVGSNDEMSVYDPNDQGNDGATLVVTPSGGLQLDSNGGTPYGHGTVDGIDWGRADEWQALVLPPDAWATDSSSGPLDNKHWMLDGTSPAVLFLGASPANIPDNAIFTADGSPENQLVGETLPARQGLDATINTDVAGAVTQQFAGTREVTITQTDATASGTSHDVAIDSEARSVVLSNASSPQTYDVELGADHQPDYGRRFTLSGVAIDPGAPVVLGTDTATGTLTLSGKPQTVSLHIEQVGENNSDVRVSPQIPGGGAEATVNVFDWASVSQSLIYETYSSGGAPMVLILQDNPAQRRALETSLYDQLTSVTATIGDTGLRRSLQAKIAASRAHFAAGTQTAINVLGALGNEVRAQTGKKLSQSAAGQVLSVADELVALLSQQ